MTTDDSHFGSHSQHRLSDQVSANTPDIMRIRRQTVEHPFRTIKTWMGSTHFLTRTLKRVARR